MRSNKSEKNFSLFYDDVVASGRTRTYDIQIHVHNESARNAITTIQAAIKKLSVVEQYTLSTIPIPSQSPVNHTIFSQL